MADDDTDKEMVSKEALLSERRTRQTAQASLAEVQLAHTEAKSRLAELEVQASTATALSAEVARYKVLESEWGQEREIVGAGITDKEGIATARWAWGRLPEAGRPTVGDWLASDRAALSPAVRAFLPAVATTTDASVTAAAVAHAAAAEVAATAAAAKAGVRWHPTAGVTTTAAATGTGAPANRTKAARDLRQAELAEQMGLDRATIRYPWSKA
jgi:hypothetical protein